MKTTRPIIPNFCPACNAHGCPTCNGWGILAPADRMEWYAARVEALDAALTSIRCIGMGRDGRSDSESLGALVDELYGIASKAIAPIAYANELKECRP